MSKITKQSLGQLLNFYVVTDGIVSNVSSISTWPAHSIILVPKTNNADTAYKMYLTDADGKIHNIE